MNYKVETIPEFEKEAKKLAKKYTSIKSDLASLASSLKINPIQGSDLGSGIFKIRLAITSKNKGQSGGARVITYVKVVKETVFLITIFDKSVRENITKQQIKTILKRAGLA